MAKKADLNEWNNIFRLQQNAKEEHAILQARLLAILAKADGQVLDIENITADTVFQGSDDETSKRLKKHYEESLLNEGPFELSNREKTLLKNLAFSEKQKLLNYLSALAICDGDLHPSEMQYLKDISVILELDAWDR